MIQPELIPSLVPDTTVIQALPSSVTKWIVISQAVTFLGVLVGLVFNYLRDGRTRRWLEQDRKLLAEETSAAAKAVALKQAETATQLSAKQAESAKALADHTTQQTADLRQLALERADKLEKDLVRIATELADTKEAAGAAYQEANHVNIKISDLNQRLLDAEEKKARPSA
jgi:hypothetical protein